MRRKTETQDLIDSAIAQVNYIKNSIDKRTLTKPQLERDLDLMEEALDKISNIIGLEDEDGTRVTAG